MNDLVTAKLKRLIAANTVLGMFAPRTSIQLSKGGVFISWTIASTGKTYRRRWSTRGQSFYPVWHRLWPHGGTASTALSQLVRWVQGRPTFSLVTWRYWACDKVKLIADYAAVEAVLKPLGYPDRDVCVLCDQVIDGQLDWWHLDGVSGPCCGWTTGCRQKVDAS